MTRGGSALMGLLITALLLGCGDGVIQRIDGPRDPLASPKPGRLIQVQATPKEVEVYVDGAYQGRLDGYRQGVLRLKPEARRIRLSKLGFEDWYGLIPAGERIRLTAELIRKIP